MGLLVSMIAWGLLVSTTAAAEEALVIEGDWYLLVHFIESVDENDVAGTAIGVEDYKDAVWRFERAGERLRWTIYSEVDFRDESGRFEEVRGERVRIAHTWWPTASQMDEIRGGVHEVDRSARTRALRRDGGHGWRSGMGARAGSASAVAYGETWSIAGLDARPVFELAASLESGRARSLSGVTRFSADAVDVVAGRIEGDYVRDDRERGRFILLKKGVRSESDSRFIVASGVRSFFGPGGAARMPVVELEARIGSGDESRENRREIRAAIESLVEESYTRRGLALHPHAAEIEAFTSEIERLAVVEGVPLGEVDRRYSAGEITP